MKVTTASFYRINGASTQRKGVGADIVIPSTLDGLDIGEDKLPGSLPWTQIEQALYIPVADVSKFVPQLKEHSAKRLADNARYVRYCTLVRHVQEVNERKEVPLEINARRKLMKAENEMRKLQDDVQDASKEGRKTMWCSMSAQHSVRSVTLTGGADIRWRRRAIAYAHDAHLWTGYSLVHEFISALVCFGTARIFGTAKAPRTSRGALVFMKFHVFYG